MVIKRSAQLAIDGLSANAKLLSSDPKNSSYAISFSQQWSAGDAITMLPSRVRPPCHHRVSLLFIGVYDR